MKREKYVDTQKRINLFRTDFEKKSALIVTARMAEEMREQNVIKSRKLQSAETEAGWEKTLQSDSDLLTELRRSNVRP